MKTELQKRLAQVAPSINIRTIWDYDDEHTDIRKDCPDMEIDDPDYWQAWQSTVEAVAIVGGDMLCGKAHLGGTWEHVNTIPWESNPQISGYEAGMTADALTELGEQTADVVITNQIIQALSLIRA